MILLCLVVLFFHRRAAIGADFFSPIPQGYRFVQVLRYYPGICSRFYTRFFWPFSSISTLSKSQQKEKADVMAFVHGSTFSHTFTAPVDK